MSRFARICLLVFLMGNQAATALAEEAAPEAASTRQTPWETSRVTGSPDPAPPYRTEPVYAKLTFKEPVTIARMPEGNRLLVMQLKEGIRSFVDEDNPAEPDLFFDFAAHIKNFWRAYGIAFHPQFKKNRYCYVCYVLKRGDPLGSRVSRFKVAEADPPYLIPESEQILISWPSGGHNGGSIQFGADGYLYISSGDGSDPVPPDIFSTGQNLGDLRSKIMRIDVDHTSGDLPYAIPADNPFVELEGARPEVWAYGVRNPWKMVFDPTGKELWLGDVGWEMWEQIHRIVRGGNYGWSIMEASQPIHPEHKRGPTALVPPVVALSRSEALSITGGVFYQGKEFQELQGAYTYGDFITGTIWALKHGDEKLQWQKVLAQTTLEIIDFGSDRNGELLILDYGGGIHRLVKNETADNSQDFPRQLSQTGLFRSVAGHELAPGVEPYSIQAPMFADRAESVRFLALPGNSQIELHADRAKWVFPKDAVLGKTIFLDLEQGNPASRRRLETQLMHFDGVRWNGYTYAWNDEQTDAELVGLEGVQKSYQVRDAKTPGGHYRQNWHLQSRTQCGACHNRRVNFTVAFDAMQLSGVKPAKPLPPLRDSAAASTKATKPTAETDQFAYLLNHGYFTGERGEDKLVLCDPYDMSAALTHRARSYLHANCAHCHRHGGGGNAQFKLQYDFDLVKAGYIGTRPVVGTFGLPRPAVVAPGDPYRSALYYRMAKLGGGRMPHIGAEQVDLPGLDLLHAWISALPPTAPHGVEAAASATTEAKPTEETTIAVTEGDGQTETVSQPTAVEIEADRAYQTLLETLKQPGNSSPNEEQTSLACQTLLGTTTGALRAVHALDHADLPKVRQQELIDKGSASLDPNIRDLFERFLPEERHVKRLGNIVDARELLRTPGDIARGKKLFFESTAAACKNCHRIGNEGGQVGPELSQIGKRLKPAELLESILEPSKKIDPKFVTYLAETDEGRVFAGLLKERTDERVVLVDGTGKLIEMDAESIEVLVPQQQSLMPDLLFRDMTAEQLADLLAYLSSLKE